MLVTGYFWWKNIKGIHESSGKALRIMQITTRDGGGAADLVPVDDYPARPCALPPAPLPRNLHLSQTSLGWFKGTFWPSIPIITLIIAFGHSLLSMSGFETLAQVYREIAYPKMKNLQHHRQYRVLVRGDVHRRDHGVRGHDYQPRRHPQSLCG